MSVRVLTVTVAVGMFGCCIYSVVGGEGPVTMYREVVYCGGQWVYLKISSEAKMCCTVHFRLVV